MLPNHRRPGPAVARAALFAVATLVAVATLAAEISHAQLAPEPVLSVARSQDRGECTVLRVEFHGPVQYLSHGPQTAGDEVRVAVKPTYKAGGSLTAIKESIRTPAGAAASVHAIEFERDGTQSALKIYFRRTVSIQVVPGPDARSILVALGPKSAATPCAAQFDDAVVTTGLQIPSASGTAATAIPSGKIDADKLEQLLVEARAAASAKQDDRALQLLSRISEAGESKHRAEALELLGVVRERKGHLAHARAEFEQYLKLFPAGDGAVRVRQRLAIMNAKEKAAFDQAKALPAAASTLKLGTPSAADTATPTVVLKGSTGLSSVQPLAAENPDAWRLSHSGSVATTYYRNQGGRDFFVAPKVNKGWEKENIYQVYQNSVLGTVDDDTSFENGRLRGSFRFSGSDEHKFIGDQPDDRRITTLSLQLESKLNGLSGQFGRQSKYDHGVLGRFDGALASYRFSDVYKWNVVAGSPVERAKDSPFKNDRYFYGTSIDMTPMGKKGAVDGNLYFVEQKSEGILDRQSVGAEARYHDTARYGFAVLDYDTHYNTINMAMLNTTQTFKDHSSLSGSVDYRRSPMVFTSNALQGQTALTLTQLLKLYRIDEVEEFALDRTARSATLSATYSRPLSDKYTVNADVTLTNMSATRASLNVPATPDTGWDVYTAAQLVGTSILREGDVLTGGLRYADTQTAHRSMIELTSRQPLKQGWSVSPQMRVGFVDYSNNEIKEYHIMPALKSSYYVMRDLAIDFEVANKWVFRDSHKGRENETEFLMLTGMRYDFNTSRAPN
jgi:hypothetical protein